MKWKTDFSINGIQQVGVGTCDFRKSWDWFIQHLGFDIKILEDDTVAERMLPYTGGRPQRRHACIAVNLNGGGGLEIWQYSERQPKPADKPAVFGDLGIFAAKIRCRNVVALHRQLSDKNIQVTPLSTTPDGKFSFFLNDLYGNTFQVIQCKSTFIRQSHLAGGVSGAMIGVSDMESSIRFYREVLGYDIIRFDVTGVHEDWAAVPGGDQTYRRVLLASSKKASGPFGGLFGKNSIELVQALDRTPVKLYEGRYWGDPGFIQICYDVTGMDVLGRYCASLGHPFTVDSCPDGQIFDMGDASGRFTYVEDPDGTLIEFVETYRIPVVQKFNWYIDLTKRKRHLPLPKFLFRAMELVSRQ